MRFITTGLTLLITGLLFCAKAAEPTPKPPEELQKMKGWVGKWHLEENDMDNPWGPAGHSKMDTEMRFINSGFAFEEAGREKGSSGTPFSYSMYTYYDAKEKGLRALMLNSLGEVVHMRVKLGDSTFHGEWDQDAKGKTYKCKGTATLAADHKSWTYEWSYSEDGVNWKKMFDGKAIKMGGTR